MTDADRFTLLIFLVVMYCIVLYVLAQAMLRKSKKQKVADRLQSLIHSPNAEAEERTQADVVRARREARRRRLKASLGSMGAYWARMETIAGRKGIYTLVVVVPAMFIAMLLVNWLVLPFPTWIEASLALLIPLGAAYLLHQALEDRFRNEFLAQMPDILDTITRASQAGIPVAIAIRNIGEMYRWPAGPEFRRIGQSLQLGNEMEAVLDEAELRIRLPDFSFLCVCLILQRETGGSLSATLSNLATVIRERRDLRMKAHALTSEGRIMSKVLAAIPLSMLALMWWLNPDYIGVLFFTHDGNVILAVAAVMMIIGLALVHRLAKLNV